MHDHTSLFAVLGHPGKCGCAGDDASLTAVIQQYLPEHGDLSAAPPAANPVLRSPVPASWEASSSPAQSQVCRIHREQAVAGRARQLASACHPSCSAASDTTCVSTGAANAHWEEAQARSRLQCLQRDRKGCKWHIRVDWRIWHNKGTHNCLQSHTGRGTSARNCMCTLHHSGQTQ